MTYTTITARRTCGCISSQMYAQKPTKREMDTDKRRMESTPFPRCAEKEEAK